MGQPSKTRQDWKAIATKDLQLFALAMWGRAGTQFPIACCKGMP